MKRIVALAAAVILLFFLTGCDKKKSAIQKGIDVNAEQAAAIAVILDDLGIDYRYVKLVTDPDEDPLLYMVRNEEGYWYLLGLDPSDGVVTNVLDVLGGRELYRNMDKDVELYGNRPK